MKIKTIIIEGFKSYCERTTLSDFDFQFNSITGLNGTGKSNILDAICFILGLQSWSLARAHGVRELIYKNAQAGIKQASVTIIFSNDKPEQLPEGFKHEKEIIITRVIKLDDTRFYLNGKRETNTKIRNFFKIIGLNIDNHNTFFVQQGRITSIVNFHPRELLSFIEEAAGVSYYITVANQTIGTLAKKDVKLKEVDQRLKEDLEVELARLEKEFSSFNIWRDLEMNLNKMQFRQKEIKRKLIVGELEQSQQELDDLKSKIKTGKKKRDEFALKINNLTVEISKETEDGKFENAESELKKISTEFQESKELINELLKDKQLEEENLKSQRLLLLKSVEETKKIDNEVGRFEWEIRHKEEKLERVKLEIELLNSGQDPLALAESNKRRLENEYDKLSNQINKYEEDCRRSSKIIKEMIDTREDQEVYAKKLRSIIENKEKLREEKSKEFEILEKKCIGDSNLKKKLSEIESQLNFKLSEKRKIAGVRSNDFEVPMVPNLKEKSVIGRVFQLFRLKDERYIDSLDAAAGGKLFFIVVSDDETAQKMIDSKRMPGRVSFIPLNKVFPNVIDVNLFSLAQQIAKQNEGMVYSPFEFIEYQEENKKAIEFVFGDKLIVSSLEVGRLIANDNRIGKVCVTLEGDLIYPKGVMEGGHSERTQRALTIAMKIKSLIYNIEELNISRSSILEELEIIKNSTENADSLKSIIEELENQLRNLKGKLGNLRLNEAEEMLNAERSKLTSNEREILKLKEMISEIEKNLGSLKGIKGEQGIKKRKEELLKEKNETTKSLNELRSNNQQMKVEKEGFIREEKEIRENLISLEEKVRKIVDEINNKEEKTKQIEKFYLAKKQKLDELKHIKGKKDSKRSQLNAEKEESENTLRELEKELIENDERLKNIEKRIKSLQKDLGEAMKIEETQEGVEKLIKELKDIESEIFNLEKTKEGLEKRLNKDSEVEFSRMKERLEDLKRMRNIVGEDRSTLESNVHALDDKKIEAVKHCFKEVNEKLGEIFSQILPGASAKMEMQDSEKGKGIVMKVAFNGQQKESLSQLSGGQRSLLALSFLLALLRYRPSPFYILDEVDAALDLAHTENLGVLLSKHFPQSQFIVISLKEEFFNNANVIFKTSLLEGRSKVERFQLKSK